MSGSLVLFAFDPVEELEGRSGVIVCADELAQRLIAEHRAELLAEHARDSLRYVTGSATNLAAAANLRAARSGLVGVTRVQPQPRPRKIARLER